MNEEIKRELSEIIRELKDPRVHSLVSVVRVEVTKDLKFCKVYISAIGKEDAKDAAVEGLKSAAGFVRREVSRRLNLRNTPEFHFVADRSIEHGAHIHELIEHLND